MPVTVESDRIDPTLQEQDTGHSRTGCGLDPVARGHLNMTQPADFHKRDTLKTISAAAAVTMTPSLASAVCSSIAVTSRTETNDTGLHLSFDGHMESGQQVVTLRNNSDRAVTLKHVSPGHVKAEGSLFDINTLLADGPVHLQVGETRTMTLPPIARDSREKPLPAGVIDPRAISVSSRYHAYPVANRHRIARTKRMLLS